MQQRGFFMDRIGKSHVHSHAAGQGTGAMPLLYGVIAMLCVFCILWTAASLLVSLWKDPLLLLPHAAHLVMLLTAFFGSLLFARKVGKNGALCGLLGAGVFCLLILLLSVTVGAGQKVNFGQRVLWLGLSITAGVLGGLLGARKKEKKDPKKVLKKHRH